MKKIVPDTVLLIFVKRLLKHATYDTDDNIFDIPLILPYENHI